MVYLLHHYIASTTVKCICKGFLILMSKIIEITCLICISVWIWCFASWFLWRTSNKAKVL